MKKVELGLGIISFLGISLILLLIPGGSFLLILSLSAISMIYMYLSFALFNNISFQGIFKAGSYKGIHVLRIVGAVAAGIVVSMLCIGVLFKLMAWKGAVVMAGIGIFPCLPLLLVVGIKYLQTKADYYLSILQRIAVWGGLALLLILIPQATWVSVKYRNHPDYVKAVKKSLADPKNEELLQNAERERRKMFNLPETTFTRDSLSSVISSD